MWVAKIGRGVGDYALDMLADNAACDIDNTIGYQFHIQVQYKANEHLLIGPAFTGCYANWQYTQNAGTQEVEQRVSTSNSQLEIHASLIF